MDQTLTNQRGLMANTGVNTAANFHRPFVMKDLQEHATEAAALLKALANEQRLQVLCCLLNVAKSVGEINEQITLSQSALSQHLSVLRSSGLVTTRRESQTIHYSLAQGPALKIMKVLYDTYCKPTSSKARHRSPNRKAV
jgi:DNA-binding transcriptional ArsR family regulator